MRITTKTIHRPLHNGGRYVRIYPGVHIYLAPGLRPERRFAPLARGQSEYFRILSGCSFFTHHTFIHYVGERVNDIFDTLPDRGDNNNFKAACDALTTYFTPKKNVSFEIFKLQHAPGESIDEYHTRLQIVAKYCEFHDHDTEIKLRIELRASSKKLRQHSFRNSSLTLTQLISYARTLAETEKQAFGIANN